MITFVKPMIDSLVEKVIAPKINEFAEKSIRCVKKNFFAQREHFSEYLFRTYKKYSTASSLALKNAPRKLVDIYQPISLRLKGNTNEEISLLKRIEKFPEEFFRIRKVLVTDTAGMGKSTFLKRIFLDVVEREMGIPLFIELRRLSKSRPVIMEIAEQINSLAEDFDFQLLLEFIQSGNFIFFLDGYDEIALEDRSFVTSDLQSFISKAEKNIFVLSSRPDHALASFTTFQVATINPLQPKEAYELLRKYDNQGRTSKLLIEKLRQEAFRTVGEFLKNPLLASLLFLAFDHKQTIPLKKHIFYRQVYDAYFDSHDLSKGDGYTHQKHSNLDIDDFDRVLRHIGFQCMRAQKIEFEKDELLKMISAAREFLQDLEFHSSDFFQDILSSVPLFCEDGIYYKWAHKSLQEYFAAQFIFKDSKQNQDRILSGIYRSNNLEAFFNLLDLYYDIDRWGFRKNILLPLFEEYAAYYETKIFSSPLISKTDIECRIGRMFEKQSFALVDPKLDSISFPEVWRALSGFNDKNGRSVPANHIVRIGGKSPFLFVAIQRSGKHRLLSLVRRRDSHYFGSSEERGIANTTLFRQSQFTEITTRLGEDSIDAYRYINCILGAGFEGFRYFLDIEKCKNEIQVIKERIKQESETDSFSIF